MKMQTISPFARNEKNANLFFSSPNKMRKLTFSSVSGVVLKLR